MNKQEIFSYIKNKYQGSALIQRFADGTLWSFCAGLIYNGTFLLVGILLSNLLGKYSYGQYGMVRSTVNMFLVFASFALGTTATKYVAEYRFANKEKTERIINLSLLVAITLAFISGIICCLFSGYIANETLHTPSLIISLRLGALMIFVMTIYSVVNGVLIGYEEFFLIFKQNLIAAVFLLIGSSCGGYFFQLNGALCGLLLYLFISLGIGCYYLRKIYIREKLKFSFQGVVQEISVLWKFSLPTALGGLVYTPIIWIVNTILVNSPAGYEAMAGLDIIRQWYSSVLFLPTVAGRVVLPLLSNFSQATQARSYNKVLLYSLLVNVGSALLIGTVLYLFSPILLSMYGPSFADLKNPLGIMMLVAVIFVANSIVGQVILSKNYAWWGFLFNSIWATIFLLLNIYFVKEQNMGIIGVTCSYLISYLLHTVIQSMFCWLVLRNKLFLEN